MERTTVYAVNPVCGNQMKPMTLKPKTLKNLSTLILLFLDPFSQRIVRYSQVIIIIYDRKCPIMFCGTLCQEFSVKIPLY